MLLASILRGLDQLSGWKEPFYFYEFETMIQVKHEEILFSFTADPFVFFLKEKLLIKSLICLDWTHEKVNRDDWVRICTKNHFFIRKLVSFYFLVLFWHECLPTSIYGTFYCHRVIHFNADSTSYLWFPRQIQLWAGRGRYFLSQDSLSLLVGASKGLNTRWQMMCFWQYWVK